MVMYGELACLCASPNGCSDSPMRFRNCQYFIRQNAASTIAHRMQYLDEPLDVAAQYVVDDLFKNGGVGGIIALDRQGNGK